MKAQESDQKVVSTLESLLKKTKGKVSPEDLSSETGYPLRQVNDALGRLLELYTARVTMDSGSGRLFFKFDYPLNRRGSKSLSEIMLQIAEGLWKIFKIIYKASIGVVLVIYTVIFVIILIGIMLAGRGNDNDSKGFDIGPIIGGLFRGLLDAFTINMWMRSYSYSTDPYGDRYKHYNTEPNKGRSFIKSVYSFVFGPDRPPYDPLEDHREVAAFIRKNSGKITAGHIVALTGVSYDEAESRLAEYASRFNGELFVSSDGVLVAEFFELLNKQSTELEGGKIIFYEDEVEAPYELTGNKNGRNFAIIAMNTFNFIMSFVAINFFSGAITISPTDDYGNPINTEIFVNPYLSFGLGYFPLIFSSLFFLIPAIRYFYVRRKNKQRDIGLLRKKLIGAFVRHHTKIATFDEIIRLANLKPGTEDEAKKYLEKLVLELKGELNIDTQGNPVYSFSRLSRELGIK